MAKPESKAEHRWLVELWESRLRFIRTRARVKRWAKHQLSKARRRAARQVRPED